MIIPRHALVHRHARLTDLRIGGTVIAVMTLWLLSLACVGGLCVMLSIALADPSKASEIRGVVIDKSGRVRMSQGLRAERTTMNTARIFVGGGQGERGTVACVCKGRGSGCLLSIINDALFCKNSGCSDCKIEVKPTKPVKTQ